MIRKIFLLTLIFICSSTIFAQNTIEETTLEELEITSKKKKKIKKHKISGKPAFNSISQGEFIVTSVNQLPEGKVKSVSFYFNTAFVDFVDVLSGYQFNVDYIDVELGLLVYEMDKDDQLGNLISDCEIKFIVPHHHKGAFKVDISDIDLPDENFFIGFKVLSQTNKDESNIYLRLFESDSHVSYSEIWMKDFSNPEIESKKLISNFAHLKMTFEIEQ
ncbi:hypothetical protein [Flavobacterium sp. I3-2]|uniref:hypothetical protein n=1 Tax=Flavobacterium sp. I3-2 TaxID=2748319 RepID=UPI0015A91D24|nr:hypothetical protein [Flavobacterium sp. I3-2]